jgi:hypothetical protein
MVPTLCHSGKDTIVLSLTGFQNMLQAYILLGHLPFGGMQFTQYAINCHIVPSNIREQFEARLGVPYRQHNRCHPGPKLQFVQPGKGLPVSPLVRILSLDIA